MTRGGYPETCLETRFSKSRSRLGLYSRRNCLILHGCKIPAQESYSEFESYVIHKA